MTSIEITFETVRMHSAILEFAFAFDIQEAGDHPWFTEAMIVQLLMEGHLNPRLNADESTLSLSGLDGNRLLFSVKPDCRVR